ncbi:MAG: hypothetical protein SOZ78_00005 [Eubacteriales bacterium]|nr:hypothetical protein [Eubacteriales bacterium]
MGNKTFRKYYLFSLLGVLLASCYPIYMGISVIVDMIRYGTVYAENYPKYIIPYTPIALALLVGVALIPVAIKYFKRYALLFGTVISTVLFFVFEFILERTVTVTRTVTDIFSTLEDWQMYMCYVPPNSFEERTWTEVDVLMGEYSPAFKLHFYIISIVLIISILNCFYGFAKMIHTGDKSRRKSLVIQSAASGAFLGMCIWACFTAFYRNGDIQVSALSAVLMSVFFVLFGVTVGIYIESFTLNKKPLLSVWLPSVSAAVVTLVMYIGEMILLSGHLYRFGDGFFFAGIPGIVLAPVDIVVILGSGVMTAIIASFVRNKNT